MKTLRQHFFNLGMKISSAIDIRLMSEKQKHEVVKAAKLDTLRTELINITGSEEGAIVYEQFWTEAKEQPLIPNYYYVLEMLKTRIEDEKARGNECYISTITEHEGQFFFKDNIGKLKPLVKSSIETCFNKNPKL